MWTMSKRARRVADTAHDETPKGRRVSRRVIPGAAGLAVAAALLLSPVASADTTPTNPVGMANNSTANVFINGVNTTTATVDSNATINMQVDFTLGGGNPSWTYWVGYGWQGGSAAGCSDAVFLYPGYTSTTTYFNLTAPNLPGTYNVVGNLAPDPCGGFGGAGTTIAVITVPPTFANVCAAAQSYSTDPAVASGLCDKLAAMQAAESRGQTSVVANVLKAFDNQVKAQTGKALSETEAANLTDWAAQL